MVPMAGSVEMVGQIRTAKAVAVAFDHVSIVQHEGGVVCKYCIYLQIKR